MEWSNGSQDLAPSELPFDAAAAAFLLAAAGELFGGVSMLSVVAKERAVSLMSSMETSSW